MRDSTPHPDFSAPNGTAAEWESLQDRVRRLEDAVAAMQDTRLMEDRVVERLAARTQQQAPLQAFRDSAQLLVDAGRALLPKAIEASRPPPVTVEGTIAAPPTGRPWLLIDLYREFRTVARMLFDYRYQASWTARLVLPLALGMLVASWFVVGNIPVIGFILDRLVDMFVAVFAYKVLHREVQQYRTRFPYPPGWR